MRKIALLLFLALSLPLLAQEKAVNLKVVAYEYYDEYEKKWYQVDTIELEQLTDPYRQNEQSFGGVQSAELSLTGMTVGSKYRVYVRWKGGATKEETYTAYEPGNVNLWWGYPTNY